MKRKSPIRHHVRTYKRRTGKTVYQYERGHGKKKVKVSTPRLKPKTQNSINFFINVRYVNTQLNESYPVSASTYPEAVELALLARSHITPPTEIEVSRK